MKWTCGHQCGRIITTFIVGISMSSAVAKIKTSAKAGALVQSAFAVVFGVFIVGVTGFANIDVVHNAAHDARHANAFPCH